MDNINKRPKKTPKKKTKVMKKSMVKRSKEQSQTIDISDSIALDLNLSNTTENRNKKLETVNKIFPNSESIFMTPTESPTPVTTDNKGISLFEEMKKVLDKTEINTTNNGSIT